MKIRDLDGLRHFVSSPTTMEAHDGLCLETVTVYTALEELGECPYLLNHSLGRWAEKAKLERGLWRYQNDRMAR